MPETVSREQYRWLFQLGLLSAASISADQIPLSFDDRIYIENGFLIAKLLAKLVPEVSSSLLKVRKIAHLRAANNWSIIREVSAAVGCSTFLSDPVPTNSEIKELISELFGVYAAAPSSQPPAAIKYPEGLDIIKFNPSSELKHCHNLLELICAAACQAFSMQLNQCLNLFVNRAKLFRTIIIKGLPNSSEAARTIRNRNANTTEDEIRYTPIRIFYRLLTAQFQHLEDLISNQVSNESFLMHLLSAGLNSSAQVCIEANVLILKICSSRWMQQVGVTHYIQSPHDYCRGELVSVFSDCLNKVFNEAIPARFSSPEQWLLFVPKLMRFLPTCLRRKQILDCLSVSFIIKSLKRMYFSNEVTLKTRTLTREAGLSLITGNSYVDEFQQLAPLFDPSQCSSLVEKIQCILSLCEAIQLLFQKNSPCVRQFLEMAVSPMDVQQLRDIILPNLYSIFTICQSNFSIGRVLQGISGQFYPQSSQFQFMGRTASIKGSLAQNDINSSLEVCFRFIQKYRSYCFMPLLEVFAAREEASPAALHIVRQAFSNVDRLILPEGLSFKASKPIVTQASLRSKKNLIMKANEALGLKKVLFSLTSNCSVKFLQKYLELVRRKLNKKSLEKQIDGSVQQFLKKLAGILSAKLKMKQVQANSMSVSQVMTVSSVATPKADKISRIDEANSFIHQDTDFDMENQFLTEPTQLSNNLSINKVQFDTALLALNPQEPIKQPKKNERSRLQIDIIESNLRSDQLQKNKTAYSYLEPFSQIVQNSRNRPFLAMDSLQHHEVVYANSLWDEYSNLQEAIEGAFYESNSNTVRSLKSIGLDKYLTSDEYQTIMEGCKAISSDTDRIKTLMLNLAIAIFGFKKQKRVFLTCFRPCLDIVAKSLRVQAVIKPLATTVQYQASLRHFNGLPDGYCVAAQTINDLVRKAIGIDVFQPFSKISVQMLETHTSKNKNNNNKAIHETALIAKSNGLIRLEPTIDKTHKMEKAEPNQKITKIQLSKFAGQIHESKQGAKYNKERAQSQEKPVVEQIAELKPTNQKVPPLMQQVITTPVIKRLDRSSEQSRIDKTTETKNKIGARLLLLGAKQRVMSETNHQATGALSKEQIKQ